ncbi:AEC family transporter [Breznakiella homolactica]|uniref:AEC family transporter n=1 Tax=Breznakiella homolactica TaxID=2798577 RepID=A0A7T7XMN5_9SPIR|nr:AEC family transporter [Breznakiella homolactica]QQO09101.1 AEC family transporter [Breznakiella homolactica]
MDFSVIYIRLLLIVAMIVIGFIAKKAGILDDSAPKTITGITFNISLPMLIFSSVYTNFSPDNLGETGIVLLIAISIYGACFLLSVPYAKILGLPKQSAGVHQYCIVFSNVAFVGIPIIRAFWPADAMLYASMFIVVFSLFNHTAGAYILSGGKGRKLKDILLTPSLLGALLGLILSFLRIPVGPELLAFVNQIGGITTPLAMFSIGITIASLPIREALMDKRVYLTCLLRLVVLPLGVCGILRPLFPDNYYMWAVPTLIAAMPSASTIPILAQRYHADTAAAGKLLVCSTVLAVFTIPALAYLVLF